MLTYFAYGSNMLTARLVARCDGARVVGTARLADHGISFAKRGRDGSGKATLVRQTGAVVAGVAYDLPALQAADLDRIEGDGYARIDCELAVEGRRMAAFSYIATAPEPTLVPHDWYLALVVAGYREHGLDAAALLRHRRTPDPDPARAARIEALAALAHAGHDDWSRLISPGTT